MSDRERFEAWISGPPYELKPLRYPDDATKCAWPGSYRSLDIDLAWCAWQAALSAPRHEAPEVRLDGEELDELVGNGSFHLENMDTNLWWMELSNPAGAVSVWLRARGKITVHYERRPATHTGAPLPQQPESGT